MGWHVITRAGKLSLGIVRVYRPDDLGCKLCVLGQSDVIRSLHRVVQECLATLNFFKEIYAYIMFDQISLNTYNCFS